jgi:hypothetical protein
MSPVHAVTNVPGPDLTFFLTLTHDPTAYVLKWTVVRRVRSLGMGHYESKFLESEKARDASRKRASVAPRTPELGMIQMLLPQM